MRTYISGIILSKIYVADKSIKIFQHTTDEGFRGRNVLIDLSPMYVYLAQDHSAYICMYTYISLIVQIFYSKTIPIQL